MQNIEKIYDDIYKKIFMFVSDKRIDVFLCGAANGKGNESYRSRIRRKLETNKKIMVWYPEEVFTELLGDKNYDLLTLEKKLADNSDVIVIACESPGSFAELGAFVNNKNTCDKVIALTEKKYKNQKSFINIGLLRHLEHKDKKSILYYNKNKSDDLDKVERLVRKKAQSHKGSVKNNLELITSQYYFILLLLFFFKQLSYSQIKYIIRYITKDIDGEHLKISFDAALKQLFNDAMIEKEDKEFLLTKNGFDCVNTILENLPIKSKTKLFDKIRLDIMNMKYYKGDNSLAPSS